jgi:DNA-binding CsgD family transcriptional regulator
VIWGRSSELDELEGLVTGALSGAGAVALLEGPPGIGKSRMLEAAGELGGAKGMTVASGRADELDQVSPWLTLVGALSSSDPQILDREAVQATPERLDQRGAVLDVLGESLERAAAQNPVMVLLDDLQWADQATVGALGWLPEQLFSYPIVWLLARRPLPGSSLLDALITRLDGLGARHLPLGPLDAAATLALANEVAGGQMDVDAYDLLSATGGNPLFIVEVSRGYRTIGVPPQLGRDRDHPRLTRVAERSLRGVVETHLRSLSQSAVELLKVASVLGREFSAAEVSELTGRPSAQLLSATEEAIAAGVLLEGSGQLAFGHDLFRQVVYSAIPGSLRRSLHAEAAAVLRRHGASATRLAHQLTIGAEAGDPEAVASLYQAVGELVGTSPWSAADLALRLVELTPPETDDHTTAVSMAVQLLGWVGRNDEACALGERFLESAVVSPVREAEILLGIRRAWLIHQNRPYPRPLPVRILEDVTVPAGIRATLLAFEQIEPLGRGHFARADAALTEAAGLLAGAGSDLDAAAVQPLWVASAMLQGQFLVAIERARSDLQLSTHQAVGMAITEFSVALCLNGLGRVQEGLETIERAIQAAESSGFSVSSTQYRGFRAAFYLDAGRLDDARAEAAAASDDAFEAGFLSHAALALTTLIESSVRTGDLAGADAALRQLLGKCEGDAIFAQDECWASAIVAEAHGRSQMAMHALQPVFAALEADNFAILARHPGRMGQLVDLALRHGEEDVARSAAAAAVRLARANEGVAILDHIALHVQGLMRRDVAALREAHELTREAETRLCSAVLTEHLGIVEADVGRRSEAVATLEEALASFIEMGAHFDAARVRAALRKLGVRRPRMAAARPDRGWAALTPAELSVVRGVGRGLTNRAVADELGVSSDTVNTHLRHAFTKLEIRSRRELARLVPVHDR